MRAARRFPLLLTVAMAAGCSHRLPPAPPDPNSRTTLRVENRGYPDMTIYVVRSGERIRLGLAPGNSTTAFVIPGYLITPGTPLQFLADPIGGRRSGVSQELSVQPGEEVRLQIPP